MPTLPNVLVWVVVAVQLTASFHLCAALPLPPYVRAVSNQSEVIVPIASPRQSSCMVGFDDPGLPLSTTRVLLVAVAAADAFSVTTSLQYYAARGADITLYCGAAVGAPVPLLDTYLPTFTMVPVACWNSSTPLLPSSFDVVIVPSGFEAVLHLRAIDTTFQSFLASFAQSTHQRVLITVDEAAEILMEPQLLLAFPQGTQVPYTTPSVSLAAAALNLTGRLLITNNISQAIVPLEGTAGVATASITVALTSTGADGGLIPLLVSVSRTLLGFHADYWSMNQSSPNCSNTDQTDVFSYPTAVFSRVAADATLSSDWSSFVNGNVFGSAGPFAFNASTFTLDLAPACRNDQGVNTCQGKRYGVVVAHGSHDLQLIGLLRGLAAVGAEPEVYCPDRDEQHRIVYAMPSPPLFPSFAVTCTHFYNESYIVFDDSIIVVGGPIATHRRLRLDKPLILALDQAPSYALYGSALGLLPSIHSMSVSGTTLVDVPVAPRCPLTNYDLVVGGFRLSNVTTYAETNESTGVLSYSDVVTKQRQRELGGYEFTNVTMVSFPLFVQEVLRAQAWNQQGGSPVDKVVGALFISAAVITVAAVLGFKMVQRRLKKSRTSQYVAVRRDEDTTQLY